MLRFLRWQEWVEANGADDMDLFVLIQKLDAYGTPLQQFTVPNQNARIHDLTDHGATVLRYKGSDGRLRVSARRLDARLSTDDVPAHAFDRSRVRGWIENEDLQTVLEKNWGYKIEVIKPGLPCDFLVGWTRQPSISKDMINLVKSSIDEIFLRATQASVLAIKSALEIGDKETIKIELEKFSDLLVGLNSAIYNETLLDLKAASQGLDVIAKSSGSGGGDCGIALSFDEDDSKILKKRWCQAGIDILYEEKW